MRSLIPNPSPLQLLRQTRSKPRARRVDPTRTTLIQRAFADNILFRFERLSAAIKKHVGKDNAFDLTARKKLTKNELAINGPYQFETDAKKQKAFLDWLQTQIDSGLLGVENGVDPTDPFTTPYITSAYRQGLVRAYTDSHAEDLQDTDFYQKSAAAFVKDSFASGVAMDKIESLATRSFEEMKGLTSNTRTQLNRILADSMANGLGADDTARDMVDQIDDMSRPRANMIARTETIRAHAEGQLDSFERLGVQELSVEVEWLTADDDSVCEDCLDGAAESPYTIDEARGLIPFHPNCRCAWIINKSDVPAQDQPEEEEVEA